MGVQTLATVGLMAILFMLFLSLFFLFGIGLIILSVIRDKVNAWIGKKLSEMDSHHDEDNE